MVLSPSSRVWFHCVTDRCCWVYLKWRQFKVERWKCYYEPRQFCRCEATFIFSWLVFLVFVFQNSVKAPTTFSVYDCHFWFFHKTYDLCNVYLPCVNPIQILTYATRQNFGSLLRFNVLVNVGWGTHIITVNGAKWVQRSTWGSKGQRKPSQGLRTNGFQQQFIVTQYPGRRKRDGRQLHVEGEGRS